MYRKLKAQKKQCLQVLLFFIVTNFSHNVMAEQIIIQDVRGEGKIRVDNFDDKAFPTVNCHLVQSITPGIARSVGSGERVFAVDISCSAMQRPKLSIPAQRRHNGEEVYFRETTSSRHALVVKRYIDTEHRKLVYVLYNNKMTGEAPLVAISTVYFDGG